MTDVILSFDTEDFTSNEAADAIYREAEILREEGVKGCFCVVGLLAKQLENWGRTDVLEALKHHEIASHSYGHTLHPTINEYTDIEDFETAKAEVLRQETEAVQMIRHATGVEKMYAACPPGNQKSYVAMYAYADMGFPVYADTYCDTVDGQGVYYCNIFNVSYTYGMERTFLTCGEAEIRELLDELSKHNRVILYTHPNICMFEEFWDAKNYCKQNLHEFGQWESCTPRPKEVTDKFYENLRTVVRLLKEDKRFRITNYSELAGELAREPERVVTQSDIPGLYEAISENFYPVTKPCSLSISDMFLACRDLLMGKTEHVCGKVYGFLDTPYAITEAVTLSADDIKKSAKNIDVSGFLPTEIKVGETVIGPADWLFGAMAVLCGEETVTLQPGEQLPSLDALPMTRDCSFKGQWMQSDEFEDQYLSHRLRLQAWTMRFLKKPN
ncbi:MAG: polysaccharide deacetylase family protein [Clostridia bacterium]|nr:polysaccharide deacetylase family protein [Clostridia bacterium]